LEKSFAIPYPPFYKGGGMLYLLFLFSFFSLSVGAQEISSQILPPNPAGEEVSSWGYHLILDCRGGDLNAVSDARNIEKFVIELVEQIDMKRYGEANIVHFGSGGLCGYSLLQLIETSSVTGHFVDQNGDAYIDIFSCKPFDQKTVLNVVQKYFNPKSVKARYLVRQA